MEFYLERDEDVAGVSGIGRIAHGVMFDDGRVAMRWLTEHASTTTYDSLVDVWRIHAHGGKTRLVPHKCTIAVIDLCVYGAIVAGTEEVPGGMLRYFDMDIEGDGRVSINKMHEPRPRGEVLNHAWMAISQGVYERGMSDLGRVWGELPPSLSAEESKRENMRQIREAFAAEGFEAGEVVNVFGEEE